MKLFHPTEYAAFLTCEEHVYGSEVTFIWRVLQWISPDKRCQVASHTLRSGKKHPPPSFRSFSFPCQEGYHLAFSFLSFTIILDRGTHATQFLSLTSAGSVKTGTAICVERDLNI